MSKKIAGWRGRDRPRRQGRRRGVHEDAGRCARARARRCSSSGGTRTARSSACSPTWISRSGAAVGNALEIVEARDTVRGEGPPDFTRARCSMRAPACCRSPTSASTSRKGGERAEAVVADGSALGGLRAGGSGRRAATPTRRALPRAPFVLPVNAPRAGSVTQAGRDRVGMAALHLGAGRRDKRDEIDHAVGVVCHVKRGARVEQGALLADVHARDEAERGGGRSRRSSRPTSSATTRLRSTVDPARRHCPSFREVETVRSRHRAAARGSAARARRDQRHPADAAGGPAPRRLGADRGSAWSTSIAAAST